MEPIPSRAAWFETSIRVEYSLEGRRVLAFTTAMTYDAVRLRNATGLTPGMRLRFLFAVPPANPPLEFDGEVVATQDKLVVVTILANQQAVTDRVATYIHTALVPALIDAVSKPHASLKRINELCAYYRSIGSLDKAMTLLRELYAERASNVPFCEMMAELWMEHIASAVAPEEQTLLVEELGVLCGDAGLQKNSAVLRRAAQVVVSYASQVAAHQEHEARARAHTLFAEELTAALDAQAAHYEEQAYHQAQRISAIKERVHRLIDQSCKQEQDAKQLQVQQAQVQQALADAERNAQAAHHEADKMRALLQQWEIEASATKTRWLEREQHLAAAQEALTAQAQELAHERSTLLQREEALTQQLAALHNRNLTLRAEEEQLAALRQSFEERERRDATATSQLQHGQDQLTAERRALADSLAALEQRAAEVTALEQQLQAQRAAMYREQTTLDTDRQELNALKVKFAADAQQWHEASAALQQQQNQLEVFAAKLAAEHRDLEARKAALRDEEAHIEATKTSHVQERTQLEAMGANLAQERTQLEAMGANLAQERTQLEGLRISLLEERGQCDAAQARLAGEQQSLTSARNELAQQHQRLRDLEDSLRLERDQLTATRAALSAEHEHLLAAQAQVITAREAFVQEREDLLAEQQALREAMASLRQRMQEEQSLASRAQQDHDEAVATLARQRVALEKQASALAQERARQAQAEQRLRQALDEERVAAQAHLDSQLSQLRREYESRLAMAETTQSAMQDRLRRAEAELVLAQQQVKAQNQANPPEHVALLQQARAELKHEQTLRVAAEQQLASLRRSLGGVSAATPSPAAQRNVMRPANRVPESLYESDVDTAVAEILEPDAIVTDVDVAEAVPAGGFEANGETQFMNYPNTIPPHRSR